MAVLVTGASGFLGGRLAQILVERGDEVVILARPKSDLRHLQGTAVRVVRGDLGDTEALRTAVAGTTHVFHCAACSTDWAPRRTYDEVNVEGTRKLLAAVRQATTVERFVHVSTTDIYGYPVVPCGEEHPFRDAGLPYNQTKGAAEAAVWSASSDGIPVTVLRPATIYGPRGKDFTQEIAKLLSQRVMAYVDGGRATGGFTYVDNVAEAVIGAGYSPHTIGKAYNISDDTGASWRDYTRLFAAQLGAREPWIDLSFATAMALASAFEAVHRSLHLPGRPLLTKHAVYLLARDQEFPTLRARQDFGFRPGVSLEEGLRRSVAWLADPRAHRR